MPEEAAHEFEEAFMSPADSRSADALGKIENDDGTPWTEKLRDGWTRFLLSLMVRSPEALSHIWDRLLQVAKTSNLQKEYERSIRQPSDPERYADMLRALDPQAHSSATLLVVARLINSGRLGMAINGMEWFAPNLQASVELLTSDRPLVIGRLADQQAYIAVPIGPTRLFVGATNRQSYLAFRKQEDEKLVREVNATIAGQAVRYVWGTDDRQLRFVQNRLGRAPHISKLPF